MNEQTPLVEVCKLLPTQVAKEIMQFDAYGQKFIVEAIRSAVSFWEAQGVTLDPVEFDVVLESFAVQSIGAWMAITKLMGETRVP